MIEHDAIWRPASGHKGGWRVVRYVGPRHPDHKPGNSGMRCAETKDGRVRLFRTYQGALRAAEALNRRPDR